MAAAPDDRAQAFEDIKQKMTDEYQKKTHHDATMNKMSSALFGR